MSNGLIKSGMVWFIAAAGVLALGADGFAQTPSGTPASAPAQQPAPRPRPSPRPPYIPGPPMPGVSASLPSTAPFRVDQPGAPEIKRAVAEAKPRQQRVLVVWGGNGGTFEPKLKEIMLTPDIALLCDLEFQTVYVNVRDGAPAKDNLALAHAHDVQIKPEDTHAVLMVLDDAGVPVSQMSLGSAVDRNRPSSYNPNRVIKWMRTHIAPRPSAEETLIAALARAKEASRLAFVRFYEHREVWCDRFELWLAKPEIDAIMNKHMVVCVIHLARDGGGPDLFARFAARPESLPWYMIVDELGTPLALSQMPEGANPGRNIGFPTTDDEIEKFVAFLRVGAPGLSAEEEKVIRASLAAERESRTPHPPRPTPAATGSGDGANPSK